MKKHLIALLLLFSTLCASAQINLDESLAAQYYQTSEYDKAVVYYKRLLDQNPANPFFYERFLNCLLNLKDYKNAEKEMKRIVKKGGPNTLFYQIDLGYIFTLEGDEKNSKKQFEEVLDNLPADEEKIVDIAGAFSNRNQPGYAERSFQKGRKLLHNDMVFTVELGNIYKAAKDYQKMVDEYMALLEKDPYTFETAKDNLGEIITDASAYDLLKKAVLRKVQAQPDNLAYTEMLSWLFLQRKDFNAAFTQYKAIDKRQREGGRRLVELARIVADYQEYGLAAQIYQSVLEQGRDALYYVPAQRGLLDMKYIKITKTGSYTDEDITDLVAAYQGFIDSYGMGRPESAEVVLKLAEIEALYGHKMEDAIALLQKFTESGANKDAVARAKLALGDYYLLSGEVWEATLFYSQVEKMYKDGPLGHEAKFRNAKLSFYMGEFEWSAAQLDVLKGSTSELIANDALQLSLVIQDNLGLDSTEKPLRLYAEAELLTYKNLFADAEKKLDSIIAGFPGNSLEDDIWLLRATISMKKRDYANAFTYYEKVYTKYGDDILADDALFRAAQLQENYLNNKDKARELYEKLILEYKGSVFAVEARNRFRILRGDQLN